MSSFRFWPVATVSWLSCMAACGIFWSVDNRPIAMIALLPILLFFYLPTLLIGRWVASTGVLAGWSRGRLWVTLAMAGITFAPWALLTLPLLPFTVGALVGPMLLLTWGWWRDSARAPAPQH